MAVQIPSFEVVAGNAEKVRGLVRNFFLLYFDPPSGRAGRAIPGLASVGPTYDLAPRKHDKRGGCWLTFCFRIVQTKLVGPSSQPYAAH